MTLLEGNFKSIAFVGAGGKTTTIYNLANQLIKKGKSVIVTTTTRIYPPLDIEVAMDMEGVQKILQKSKLVVAGIPCEDGKLTCLESEIFNRLVNYADYVLIEADGAKKMPIKVPKDNEPVIPEWVDMVVGVVGMDCIGKSIKTVCFRTQEAVKLLNGETKEIVTENHLITEEDVAQIIGSEKGLKKSVGQKPFKVILNKVDNEKNEQASEKIIRILKSKGIQECLMTSYNENERA
nr:selenium cofactor biosynthesis protein YqeC [uncultured Aminipila sp.]